MNVSAAQSMPINIENSSYELIKKMYESKASAKTCGLASQVLGLAALGCCAAYQMNLLGRDPIIATTMGLSIGMGSLMFGLGAYEQKLLSQAYQDTLTAINDRAVVILS